MKSMLIAVASAIALAAACLHDPFVGTATTPGPGQCGGNEVQCNHPGEPMGCCPWGSICRKNGECYYVGPMGGALDAGAD